MFLIDILWLCAINKAVICSGVYMNFVEYINTNGIEQLQRGRNKLHILQTMPFYMGNTNISLFLIVLYGWKENKCIKAGSPNDFEVVLLF